MSQEVDRELITEDNARVIAEKFMLERYYRAKLQIDGVKLITGSADPVYHLEGTIKPRPRSQFSSFVGFSSPEQYSFSVEIQALRGTVLNYELR